MVVVDAVDLAKESWQQFLRRNPGVGVPEGAPTAGSVVEGVSMWTTGELVEGLVECRVQTLRSTQPTVRRAGPRSSNT